MFLILKKFSRELQENVARIFSGIEPLVIGYYFELACLPQAGNLVIGTSGMR